MIYLERLSCLLNKILMVIAGAFLVGMMMMTCANIFMRSFWFPLKGTFELMGFCGAIVAAFALGHTQSKREHIAVKALINLFPDKVKKFANGINYSVGMIFFTLAGWQTARLGTNLWQVHEVSETLRIIYFPFVYAVSLGCMVISLVMLVDFLKLIKTCPEVTQ